MIKRETSARPTDVVSFSEYLNRVSVEQKLIDEDLIAWKNTIVPDLTLPMALECMRYVPGYDPSMDYVELRFAVADQAAADGLVEYSEKLDDILEVGLKTGKIQTIAAPPSKAMVTLTFPEKQFGRLAGALKKRGVKFQPTRKGDQIDLAGDVGDLKNAFVIWKTLVGNGDPMSVELPGPEGSLGKDQAEFDSLYHAAKANTSVGVKAVAKSLLIAARLFIRGITGEDVDSSRDYGELATPILLASDERMSFDRSAIDMLDKAKLKDRFMKSIIINEGMTEEMQTMLRVADNEIKNNGMSEQDFIKTIRTDNIASKFINRSNIVKYQKTEAERDPNEPGAQKDHIDSAKEFLANLVKFKDINTLSQLNSALDVKISSEDDMGSYPTPTNPCAKRRMKLFKDTETLGAKILYNHDWIVALTYKPDQNGVFSRNKPKVDSQGNIIPGANMHDEEVQTDSNGNSVTVRITPANKRLRDDKNAPWIDDHLPHSTATNPFECNWCTTGAGSFGSNKGAWDKPNTSNHFNNYIDKNNPEHFYVVIMELATGMMYQYAPFCTSKMFLYENEHSSSNVGLCVGRSGDYVGNMIKARQMFPSFDAIMQKVEKVGGFQSAVWSDEKCAENMTYLTNHGFVTSNGALSLPSDYHSARSTIQKYARMFHKFSSIIVNCSNASLLFADEDFGKIPIPPIDCSAVRCAMEMFKNTKINCGEGIRLTNTHNITDMQEMFMHAQCPSISGIDTRNAVTIDNAFNDVHEEFNKPVTIKNELFLDSCKTMNYAFYHGAYRKIKLRNLNNVTSMKDAFKQCYYLEEVPIVTADKTNPLIGLSGSNIRQLGNLISEFTTKQPQDDLLDDIRLMFDGCRQLLSKHDIVESACKTIADVLFDGVSTAEKKAEVDQRGFLKIETIADVQAHLSEMHRYPGVVVTCMDATSLFAKTWTDSDTTPIRIRKLDLSGVKIADTMFEGCRLAQLSEIIGMESIESADRMFANSKADLYPDLNLLGLTTSNLTLFQDASAPRRFPNLKIGPDVTLDISNESAKCACVAKLVSPSLYIDSLEGLNRTEWGRRLQGTRLVTWIETIAKQQTDIMKERLSAAGDLLTSDGRLKVKSVSMLNTLRSAYADWKSSSEDGEATPTEKNRLDIDFSKVTGLYIDTSSAVGLFKSFDARHLPDDEIAIFLNIDCEKVVKADEMFHGYQGPLPTLTNTHNLTQAQRMFYLASYSVIADQTYDFSHVKIAKEMFRSFKKTNDDRHHVTFEGGFRSATDIDYMFFDAKLGRAFYDMSFEDLAFESATTAQFAFEYAYIPFDMSNIVLPRCENATCMFECTAFGTTGNPRTANTVIKKIDMPRCQNAESMFESNVSVIRINKVLLPSASNVMAIFRYMSRLQSIGYLDLRSATDMSEAFRYDGLLTSILVPKFNLIGNLPSMNRMFTGCPLKDCYGVNGSRIARRIQHQ